MMFLSKINLLKILKRLLLSLVLIFAWQFIITLSFTPKVSAQYIGRVAGYWNGCGAPAGENQFGGLVVESFWVRADGSHPGSRPGAPGYDSDNTGVSVEVVASNSGEGLNKIIQYQAGKYENAMPRTNQLGVGQGWFNCGILGAVFGYEGGVTGETGYGNGWALDCDAERIRVRVTGYGVPTGARPGGTWEVLDYSPGNGVTDVVFLTYREPTGPVGRISVTCPPETEANTPGITGWMIERSSPNTQMYVDIYIDSQSGTPASQLGGGKYTRVLASSSPGPDPPSAGPPYGNYSNVFEQYGSNYTNVNHSFSLVIPATFRDGNQHTVRVYPISPFTGGGYPPVPGNGDPANLVAWSYSNNPVSTFTCPVQPPPQPVFNPWLRTQNGNVLALSDRAVLQEDGITPGADYIGITDQIADLNGSRQLTLQKHEPPDPDASAPNERLYNNAPAPKFIKEASYVIVARLGTNNFCSTNFYTLGNEYGSTAAINGALQIACKSPTRGYDINQPMSQLAVYDNLSAIYGNIPKTAGEEGKCDPNSADVSKHYIRSDDVLSINTAPNLNNLNLATANGLKGKCPAVFGYVSDTLPGLNNIKGRATIIRYDPNQPNNPTDIYIAGDIIYSSDGNYSKINNVPNSDINSVPNLAIVASGDILIDPSVKRIDASLYAKGKIKTCVRKGSLADSYPSPSCGRPNPNEVRQLVGHGFWIGAKGFEWGRNYFERPGHNYGTTPNFPGNAAERIIGNGLVIAFPPPGFEDAFTPDFTSEFYFGGELNPRF
ncbi:MAG: hypothetical protein Q8P54_00615 [bacterium]|nr:hypothetical protein [bacterium]